MFLIICIDFFIIAIVILDSSQVGISRTPRGAALKPPIGAGKTEGEDESGRLEAASSGTISKGGRYVNDFIKP